MVVSFNESVSVPANLTHLNSTNIDIYVVVSQERLSESQFNVSTLNLTWVVTSFIDRELNIQLNFSHVNQISPKLQQDKLLINFNGSITSVDGKAMLPSNEQPVSLIRPQLDGSKMTNEIMSASKSTVDYMLWVLLAVLMLQATSMRHSALYFVFMIRFLQYILHMPFFRFVFPSNCINFFEIVLLVAMFDFIEQFFNWDE